MKDWKVFLGTFILCLILVQVDGQDYLYRSRVQPRLPPYRLTRYPPRIPYYPTRGYNPYLQNQRGYDGIRNYARQHRLPLRRTTSSKRISTSFLPPPPTSLQSENVNVQVKNNGDTDTRTASETQISDTYNHSVRRDGNDDFVKPSVPEDVSKDHIRLENNTKSIPVNEEKGDFQQNAHKNSDSDRLSVGESEPQLGNNTITQMDTGYKHHSTTPESKSDEVMKNNNEADNDRKGISEGQSTRTDITDTPSMDADKDETENEEKNSNSYSEIEDVKRKEILSVGTSETELPKAEMKIAFSEDSLAKSSLLTAFSTEKFVDDINQTISKPQRQWSSGTGTTDRMTQLNENGTQKELPDVDTISSTSVRKEACCNNGNSLSDSTEKQQETTQSSIQDEAHKKSNTNNSSRMEKDSTANKNVEKYEEIFMAGETLDPEVSQPLLEDTPPYEQTQEPEEIKHKSLNEEGKDSNTLKDDKMNEHAQDSYVGEGNEMYRQKQELFVINGSTVNEQMQGPHEVKHHIMDEQTQKPHAVTEHQMDNETLDPKSEQKDVMDEPAIEPQVVKDNTEEDQGQDPLEFRSHPMGEHTPKNHEALQCTGAEQAQRTHEFSNQTSHGQTASKLAVSDPPQSNLQSPLGSDKTPSHRFQHSPTYIKYNLPHYSHPLNPTHHPGTRHPPRIYPIQTQFLQPYPGRNQGIPIVYPKETTSTPFLISQKQNIPYPVTVSTPKQPPYSPSIPPQQFNLNFPPQSLPYKSQPRPSSYLSLPLQLTFSRRPASINPHTSQFSHPFSHSQSYTHPSGSNKNTHGQSRHHLQIPYQKSRPQAPVPNRYPLPPLQPKLKDLPNPPASSQPMSTKTQTTSLTSHQYSSPSLYKGLYQARPRFPPNRRPILSFLPQNHHNPNIHQQHSRPPSNIHQPISYSYPQNFSQQSSSKLLDAHKSSHMTPPPITYQQTLNTQKPLVHPDSVFYKRQHPPPFHTLTSPNGQLLYPALGPIPGPAPVVHLQSTEVPPERNDHLPRTHYFQVGKISDQVNLPKLDQKSNDHEPDLSKKEPLPELHEGGNETLHGEHFTSRENKFKSQSTTLSFSHNFQPQESQTSTQQTPLRRSQEDLPPYHPDNNSASHQPVNDTSIHQSPGDQPIHLQHNDPRPHQQRDHPRHQLQDHQSPQQHILYHQPKQNPSPYENEDGSPTSSHARTSTHFPFTPKQPASDLQPPTKIYHPLPKNGDPSPLHSHHSRPQVQAQGDKLPPDLTPLAVMADDNLTTYLNSKSQVEVLPQFSPASKRVFKLNINPPSQKESFENPAPNDDPFTIILGPSSQKNEEQSDSPPVDKILISRSEDYNKTGSSSDKNLDLNEDQGEKSSAAEQNVDETRKDNSITNNYDSLINLGAFAASIPTYVSLQSHGNPNTEKKSDSDHDKNTSIRPHKTLVSTTLKPSQSVQPLAFDMDNKTSTIILEDDFIHAVPVNGSEYHRMDSDDQVPQLLDKEEIVSLTYTQNQQELKSQIKEVTSLANTEKTTKLRSQGSNHTVKENKENYVEHKGTGSIIEYNNSPGQTSKASMNYTGQENQDTKADTERAQPTSITLHSDKSYSVNLSPRPRPNKKNRPFIIPSAHAKPFRPVIIPKNIARQHKPPQPPEETEQPHTTVPHQSHNQVTPQPKPLFPPTSQTDPSEVLHQNLSEGHTSDQPVPSSSLQIKPLIVKSQKEFSLIGINTHQSSGFITSARHEELQDQSKPSQDQHMISPQSPFTQHGSQNTSVLQPGTQQPPPQLHLIQPLQNLTLQFSQHQLLSMQESPQISAVQPQSSSESPSKQMLEPPSKTQVQSVGASLMAFPTVLKSQLEPPLPIPPKPYVLPQEPFPQVQTKPIIHHPIPPQPSLLPQPPSNTHTRLSIETEEPFIVSSHKSNLSYTPEQDNFYPPERDTLGHGIYGIPGKATELKNYKDITKESTAGPLMYGSLNSLPDFLKGAIILDNSLVEPLLVKVSQSYGKVTYN